MNHVTGHDSSDAIPRLALVGCGAVAREYYLPRLAKLDAFRRRAVLVDCVLSQAKAAAEQFGVAQYTDDLAGVPNSVDAAIITTPHRFHAPQAIQFLQAGCPVFIEKPMAMDSQEARQIVATAEATGCLAMVNNYRRLFPSYRSVHEMIRSHRLGQLRHITIEDGTQFAWQSATGFYFRDPQARGVLLDRGSHTIDVLCWWLGECPSVVRACSDAQHGVEGLMDLELQCGQTTIEIKFSRYARLANRYRIEGELATIEGRLFDFGQFEVLEHGSRQVVPAGKPETHDAYVWELLSNFFEAMRGTTSPLFQARDVLPSIELIDQAYQAVHPFAMPWYDDDPNIQWIQRKQAESMEAASKKVRG